jgi:hypothetical protein
MAYDVGRSRMVLFGGVDPRYYDQNDTWELLSSPAPPLITANPLDTTAHSGGTATLSVTATGNGPLTYQWFHGPYGAVNDGPGGASLGGGTVSGANTPVLTIAGIRYSDAGTALNYTYHCTVTDSCGTMITREVGLGVLAPCGSADFDGDGDVGTTADIEAFFACLAGDCCATCGSPDFDRDGDARTDADIEAFFRVLGGGTC